MVSKFLIAIAGGIAVMAALVLVPNLNSPPEQELGIEYSRQNLTRLDDGRFVATSAEDFVIRPDRSAVYRNITGGAEPVQFTVSGAEMDSLQGLVLSTGFMDIPGEDYPQKQGLANLTKYSLKLSSGDSAKTITWVDLEASQGSVPAIVRNIGQQLDAIIERRA